MKKNLLLTFHKRFFTACFGIALLAASTDRAYSQVPTGFTLKKLTDNSIVEATAMAHSADGRIFMAERGGKVKVYQNGTVSTVYTAQTVTDAEQGLLGITLHPSFTSNGRCYIFYTNKEMTRHYLDILFINQANGVDSVRRVMEFDQIINGAHNGGALLFRKGLLYVAIGESNEAIESPKLTTYRGKILRLTEDGQPAPGNPYYDTPNATRQQRSIWARGMRNPWRMSLDPVSQRIFVVDVGGDYEEINDVTNPDPARGYNYGWDQNHKTGYQPDTTTTIPPVYFYDHSEDKGGCAITSGLFFNPPATNYPPQYLNKFFFSDWCRDWYRFVDINGLKPSSPYTEFSAKNFTRILGTSVGIDGNIYYIAYAGDGSLYRIEYNNNQAPSIVNQPENKTVTAGDAVSFSVTASGGTPLSFQWQKNGANITGATAATYSIAQTTQADSGQYRCVVTNPISTINSNPAKLTVLPFNARPVPKILTPAATLTWNVGTIVNYSATATDAEDGTLPDSAYTWEARFYHKDTPTSEHWHPGPTLAKGVKSGSFTADNLGESSPNIWFRLMLTVKDSNGRTGVDSVDVYPNKVQVTAASNIAGISLVLGSREVAPFTKTMVVNSLTTLQAVTPQLLGDTTYDFVSWAHGGDALQSIRVPAKDTVFRATYKAGASRQNPFPDPAVPSTIPGKIEIENFDLGGEGIAYHDESTANQGNQYRTTEGVDLENCSEGGFNIGYVNNGEWLEYTANVTVTGKYTFSARVANPGAAKTFHVEMDGVNITGTVTVPTTGGFQAWQTVSTTTTQSLPAGIHVFRIVLEANDFNVNYFTFDLAIGNAPTVSITAPVNGEAFVTNSDILLKANAADSDGTIRKVEFFQGATKLGEDTTAPYQFLWTGVATGAYSITAKATDNTQMTATSAPVAINVTAAAVEKTVPGHIEAESFDAMSGIQTEGCGDTGGGENIGWVDTGDWMDYFVNVTAAGSYNVSFRVASAPGGGQLQLQSGANVLTTVDVPATGGWQAWTTISKTVTLTAGKQTLRVYASHGDVNLNWIEFAASAQAARTSAVVEQEPSIRMYPNPVVNLLTVGNVKGDGLFTITNVATSQTIIIKATNGILDVSNLTPGVYVLKFTNNGKPVTKKFVKM
ncbi:Por secretion system C-terminal sorting domain-containing protein [Chitinophaga sp. YR627]|uniref:carbohydrate-binding protein n=1 Tax=Chitinophaga sp. YR627 TaxID=1881041 RepID=UPI0008F10D34|nr:carbohydrate-binding protein [Chitinophaga sp. YR627]SFM63738.1 Por secretion system C-terminal sorting domain-containing protein [Chitinophaga sp. YR627]